MIPRLVKEVSSPQLLQAKRKSSPILTKENSVPALFKENPAPIKRDRASSITLLPINPKEASVFKFSSLEFLNSVGEGFKNDSYERTKNNERETDVTKLWRNVYVHENFAKSSRELKFLIRRGLPDLMRKKVWMSVSGCSMYLKDHPNNYADLLKNVFGGKQPTIFRNYPLFGGIISPSDHFLISEADEIVKRVLVVIGLEYPFIEYCPCLPDLVQLGLAFMSESDTFCFIQALIKKSKETKSKFLAFNKKGHTLHNQSFLKIVSRFLPKLHKRIMDLDLGKDGNFVDVWFSRLFVSSFPYQVVLRILDAWVNEGMKVLCRVGLAALDLLKDHLMKASDAAQFLTILVNGTLSMQDPDVVMKRGFGYQLSHKDLKVMAKRALRGSIGRVGLNSLSPGKNRLEHAAGGSGAPPVFYRPIIKQSSKIIADDEFEILYAWIPHRICIQDPFLIYSAELNGWSLVTMTSVCRNECPLLLIVKSDSGAVFGAYLTDPLSVLKTNFYGGRESFLWALKPNTAHYPWAGKNDLFIMGGAGFFCIGGGGSGYGLYIHQEQWGRSDKCETFDNQPLESIRPEKFQIVALEIYAFR